LVDRDRIAGVDQQCHQHAALAGMAEVDEVAVDAGLDMAQQLEFGRRHGRSPPANIVGWYLIKPMWPSQRQSKKLLPDPAAQVLPTVAVRYAGRVAPK